MASEPSVSILKEHPVEDDILSTLPYKDQQGFKTVDVKITCLDAGDDHLLFGTNVGAGFLFNRETRKTIKLLCENRQDIITCVKCLVGIECQVALGTEDGKLAVIIFSHSASKSTRQVHKYLLGNIHQSEVTSMVWSSNGMKLFSGDKNGNVYQTEVDFEKNKCSASLVFTEQHEIVQLNYKHMVLLASTYEQTLTFHMNKNENKMVLVGSKPKRKGSFGSCFNANTVSASDLQIFSARPNLRMWIADVDGKVMQTLQMKELTSSANPKILLDGERPMTSLKADPQFGRVLTFKDNLLVTHTDSSLFVIVWKIPSIVGSILSLEGILDVATTTDEIWVLCKNRQLHRISEVPEKLTAIQRNLIANKGEENQGVIMQDVKESLSEMKKSFQPLVGAFQSKMSNFNTENWTQKLQSQAKVLQSKLPSSIFTGPKPNVVAATDASEKSNAESSILSTGSPSTSRNSEQKPSPTSALSSSEDVSNEADSNSTPASDTEQEKTKDDVITQYCYEIETNNNPMTSSDLSIFDLKNGEDGKQNHDHLRSQGDPTLHKIDIEVTQIYFDKLNNIEAESDGDIVFNSKRKRRAQRGSKSSSPDNGSLHTENDKDRFELHSSLPGVKDQEAIISIAKLEVPPVYDVKMEDDLTHSDDHNFQDSEELTNPPATDKHPEIDSKQLPCEDETKDKENLQNEHPEEVSSCKDPATSVEESSKDFQELVIAVHRTSGNQLCPEIMISPVSNKPFSFTTGNVNAEHPASISANPFKDSTGTALIHDPTPESGEEEVPEVGASELDDDDDEPNAGEITPTNDDQQVDLETFPSMDDIYKVEEDGRDFESELDSEEDAQDEINFRSSLASISSSSTSHSFSDLGSNSLSVPVRLRDSWTVTSTPSQVIALAGSCNYMWYIDYYDQIYMTEETGEAKIKWKKLAKKAVQLDVSPTGDFAWIVTRSGKAYAAVLPINFHQVAEPVKLNWKLVGAGVSKIALSIDQAWVTTSNGGVKVQFNLSRQNPCNEDWTELTCTNEKVSHITLTKLSAWCRTETGKILSGDISTIPDKKFKWKEVEPPIGRDKSSLPVLAVASNCNNVLWALDDRGCLWFLSEDHEWWQVNTSQYVNENHYAMATTLMNTLPSSVSSSVHKVQSWMAGNVRVQHIAVNDQSVWIVFEKNKVQIARGPLTGSRWDITTPLGVAKSTRWQHITTSSVFSPDHGSWIGLVWAAQPSNEIFCFPSQEVETAHPVTLVPPLEEDSSIATVSACKEALWVLMQDGVIHIRSGISADCLGGNHWNKLDVSTQLGDIKIVHVSCGTQNVWALDSTGQVYFRTGVNAVDGHSLLPAWIPVDGCQTAGCRFTQIECSSSDSSVWALDNFANVYVRSEVTLEMPIGLSWEIVPGSHAQQLCISNHTIWGLRMSGNVIRRFGISERNPLGDYWKKLKGRFMKLAVTPYDELWAIDQDQRLRHHKTAIYYTTVVQAQYQTDAASKESDWTMTRKGDVDWEFV